MGTRTVHKFAQPAAKICLDSPASNWATSCCSKPFPGRVSVRKACSPTLMLLSRMVKCLPPARPGNRFVAELVSLPPISSHRERQRSAECSRRCRDHSQMGEKSVLFEAMPFGVLPSFKTSKMSIFATNTPYGTEPRKQLLPSFPRERVCISVDLGDSGSYRGDCLSFEEKHVQDTYLDVFRGTQGVSNGRLDLSYNVLYGSTLANITGDVCRSVDQIFQTHVLEHIHIVDKHAQLHEKLEVCGSTDNGEIVALDMSKKRFSLPFSTRNALQSISYCDDPFRKRRFGPESGLHPCP